LGFLRFFNRILELIKVNDILSSFILHSKSVTKNLCFLCS
jgi:hypothetical protein